jgi:hypothetical protein
VGGTPQVGQLRRCPMSGGENVLLCASRAVIAGLLLFREPLIYSPFLSIL